MATPTKIAQGTSVRIKLTIKDAMVEPAVALDVTSGVFKASMGYSLESRDSDVALTVEKTTPASGIVTIVLPADVTETMDPRKTYSIDCTMVLNGATARVYKGQFQADFTRSIQ